MTTETTGVRSCENIERATGVASDSQGQLNCMPSSFWNMRLVMKTLWQIELRELCDERIL
jgi:hypothetical protein